MRKVVIHKAGGHDRLQVEEHPDPSPGPGEVAISVEAAGVNYADVAIRLGVYRSAREFVGWPITPGFEVAGTVRAVGEGVTDLAPGAPVFAVTRFGGYASEVVAPRAQVFARSAKLDAVGAAGFPAVYLTAYFALFELAHPRPGSRLLVHSAAGGVGGALLQLAKIAECEAVGVVGSTHKVEHARRMGATHVIDRSREDLWKAAERISPEGYQVVLDANGPSTLRESYEHLGPTGRLVVYGFASMFDRGGSGRLNIPKLIYGWWRTPRFDPLRMTNENRSVLAFNLSYMFDRTDFLGEAMGKLLGWLEEDRLEVPKTTTFPLEKVAEAHQAIESGKTVGKLILTM